MPGFNGNRVPVNELICLFKTKRLNRILEHIRIMWKTYQTRMANIRYEAGMATNLEYLDALADQAQALLNRHAIFYKHQIHFLMLKQATGQQLFP